MKIRFTIEYMTSGEQTLCICGSAPELGGWNDLYALDMIRIDHSLWYVETDVVDASSLQYIYFVRENGQAVRREWGGPHRPLLKRYATCVIRDVWNEEPVLPQFYTSAFADSFFTHHYSSDVMYYERTIIFHVNCAYVNKDEELRICGAADELGNWLPQSALRLVPLSYGEWQVAIDANHIKYATEYKVIVYNPLTGNVSKWEAGNNRTIHPEQCGLQIEHANFRYEGVAWKAAGVAIPVFSLRSKDSFGIGEFSDLNKMVDWVAMTGQRVIQILPVNDTTTTRQWMDSYPYNAMSVYALHPIYLGLKQHPLNDKEKQKKYLLRAEELNALPAIDYESVLNLKWEYLIHLFAEYGHKTMQGEGYQVFYESNKYWLFAYACFCYLRDKNKTSDHHQWGEYALYNEKTLQKLLNEDKDAKYSFDLTCFVQYLLNEQLSQAKSYAHKKGVILKGDIPIGVNRHSVETWTEPRLFNLESQTGAPPDDFSVLGQNWGFPTYNWDEMAKDGYLWWVKRFRKMSDFFDAYRIDHILGFFRIWEIPHTSVQGLLGHFSPAMPYSQCDLQDFGLEYDEMLMTTPYIHDSYICTLFGADTERVIGEYLTSIGEGRYALNEWCNTQRKIKDSVSEKDSIYAGLMSLCNEVLFIRDKNELNKLHPRISAYQSHVYKSLSEANRRAFDRLYEEFFYHRHNHFWYDSAMKKLPRLTYSNSMLVCGEDLGMIPDCVPQVMQQLHILRLDIERMPKTFGVMYENLATLPYESVATTSTHDMSPLRLWWTEDRNNTQVYYNQVLGREGDAPDQCSADICAQILRNHLHSPAMLVIIPLQDWLSVDDSLKNPNPEAERINVPSNPSHYWQYRMHITLEQLIESVAFNENTRQMIRNANRG